MEINAEIAKAVEEYKILLTKFVEMKKVRETDWNEFLRLQVLENELEETLRNFKPENDRQRELERGMLQGWRETSAQVAKAEEKTRSYQEGLEPVRDELIRKRAKIFVLFEHHYMDGSILQMH